MDLYGLPSYWVVEGFTVAEKWRCSVWLKASTCLDVQSGVSLLTMKLMDSYDCHQIGHIGHVWTLTLIFSHEEQQRKWWRLDIMYMMMIVVSVAKCVNVEQKILSMREILEACVDWIYFFLW